MLVRTLRSHTQVRRRKSHPTVGGVCEKDIGLEAKAGRIIARVVERDVHVAGDRIDGKPMVEPIHRSRQLVGYRGWWRPIGALIVGERKKNVGGSGGRQVHPGTIEPTAVGSGGAVGVTGGIDQSSPE